MEQKIFKIQIALNSEDVLIYDKERKIETTVGVDDLPKSVARRVKKSGMKDFFWCVIENKEIHICGTAPWQDW